MKIVYKCPSVEIVKVSGGQSYIKIEHMNNYEIWNDWSVKYIWNSAELDEMKRVLENAMLDPTNQVEHQGESRLF
jgi:thymidylate synthase